MRAFIIGVSGQDGAYLAQLLLEKGYEVSGSSRDASLSTFANLVSLGIRDRVRCTSVAPNDFRGVLTAITQLERDEVYNLSGQNSVGLWFEQPVETMESVSSGSARTTTSSRREIPIRSRRSSPPHSGRSGSTGGMGGAVERMVAAEMERPRAR